MSWWKRTPKVPAVTVEPFDDYTLVTVMSDGSTSTINGWISKYYTDEQRAEALRYLTALRDGARAAGFECELNLIRKQVEKR